MTAEQERILLHMTGLDRSRYQYRNHYAIYPGGDNYAEIQAMVGAGILYKGGSNPGIFGEMEFYHATASGLADAKTLRAKSLKKRKPARKLKDKIDPRDVAALGGDPSL